MNGDFVMKIQGNSEKDQHFMINRKLLEKMVDLAELNNEDYVLEVGSGYGNLTSLIAEKSKMVYAIEKDEKFKSYLKMIKKKYENVYPIFEDALKIEYPPFNKIISNIPYSIAEPLFQKLINYDFDAGVMTLPYKFTEKLTAKRNDKQYSLLSIKTPLFYDIEIVEHVDKYSFEPPPKVKSSLVKITRRDELPLKENILKGLFEQSDKKLKNGLRESIIESYEKKYTKKEAKNDIDKMRLGSILDKKIGSLSLSDFEDIVKKLDYLNN